MRKIIAEMTEVWQFAIEPRRQFLRCYEETVEHCGDFASMFKSNQLSNSLVMQARVAISNCGAMPTG